jgi:glycosyltransferase involved in cell wall biosynthesis
VKRLALITTHPIQYYAPLFQLLNREVELKVFYTWGEAAVKKADPGFNRIIEWDIPLLEGYNYIFEKNIAGKPGSHHFYGIRNPMLIKDVAEFKPDAILVFGWAYLSHLRVMRFFKGKIPVWFRGDSHLLDTGKSILWKAKNGLRRLLLKRVYKYIDLAFYVGSANKAYFEWAGLRPDQLCFAPHAVDNTRFAVDRHKEAAKWRADLGIPSHATLFLFAGKFEAKKDPLLLLQAFESGGQENHYLLMTGSGNLETAISEKVSSMDKKSRVRIIGFQNQQAMPALYQMADVVCVCSAGPGETWGLAVNEALAAGRAVWVSDRTGCAVDLVKEGINGRILEAGNNGVWAEAFAVCAAREVLKEMGANGRKLISQFSFERIKDEVTEQLNVS